MTSTGTEREEMMGARMELEPTGHVNQCTRTMTAARAERDRSDRCNPYIFHFPPATPSSLFCRSSYSSQINAVSAVMWEDFFKNSAWVASMKEERRPYVNVLVSESLVLIFPLEFSLLCPHSLLALSAYTTSYNCAQV
ncbi:hypothetical protein E2C01_093010 [Portunus trituberculatus]|uniref:Uncharacterized protein n=1 Tax=Portunus trituberculatus TaxID=210409 RepID=A0A5B7JSX6_PORTR|nr:hypothetical protein [Portunus trituberculatus]